MNIYQTCYDLVNTYLFGGSIVAGSYIELVAIVVAVAASLFVFSLPFVVVVSVIKMITGGAKLWD